MQSAIDIALSPKHKRRKLSDIGYIVVHRTVDKPVAEVVEEFKDTAKYSAGYYTGGVFPYHFFIPYYGELVQCLPLTTIGPAALAKLNKTGIHVALGGDLRKKPPHIGQVIRLNHIASTLTNAWNGGLHLVGHTDDQANSKDPNKTCPGKYLSVAHVRGYIDQHLTNVCELSQEAALLRAGITI